TVGKCASNPYLLLLQKPPPALHAATQLVVQGPAPALRPARLQPRPGKQRRGQLVDFPQPLKFPLQSPRLTLCPPHRHTPFPTRDCQRISRSSSRRSSK